MATKKRLLRFLSPCVFGTLDLSAPEQATKLFEAFKDRPRRTSILLEGILQLGTRLSKTIEGTGL